MSEMTIAEAYARAFVRAVTETNRARAEFDQRFVRDETEFCAVCECWGGHSLDCATLNINGRTIAPTPPTKGTQT